jgi:hypothetical protein
MGASVVVASMLFSREVRVRVRVGNLLLTSSWCSLD